MCDHMFERFLFLLYAVWKKEKIPREDFLSFRSLLWAHNKGKKWLSPKNKRSKRKGKMQWKKRLWSSPEGLFDQIFLFSCIFLPFLSCMKEEKRDMRFLVWRRLLWWNLMFTDPLLSFLMHDLACKQEGKEDYHGILIPEQIAFFQRVSHKALVNSLKRWKQSISSGIILSGLLVFVSWRIQSSIERFQRLDPPDEDE